MLSLDGRRAGIFHAMCVLLLSHEAWNLGGGQRSPCTSQLSRAGPLLVPGWLSYG